MIVNLNVFSTSMKDGIYKKISRLSYQIVGVEVEAEAEAEAE